MRRIVTLVSIVGALVLVLSAAGVVPQKAISEVDVARKYEAHRQRVLELERRGASPAEIAATVEREFSIVPLAGGQLISATGSADIHLATPTFGYDRELKHYVMAASFTWNMCRIGSVDGAPCWMKNRKDGDGGPDGFAIKLNQLIYRVQSGFSLSDNCGRSSGNFSQPEFDSEYGIGFREQDVTSREEVNCPGGPYVYNWHHGVISEIFDFQDPSCAGERLQVDSKFGHSWSTTALTGIGLSNTGISFSWENGESHFHAIPTSPLEAYC